MINAIDKTLKNFGLSENEATIYKTSLKHDDLSPYKISKLTGIPRTTVYDVLMSLSLKGLVVLEQSDGFTKQQTRVKAKNPSVLREIINKKRKDLISLELDVVNVLPMLKDDYHKDTSNTDFQFLPGIKGAERAFSMKDNIDSQMMTWTHLMPMDAFGTKNTNKVVSDGISRNKKSGFRDKELIPLNDWTKHVISYQYGLNKEYIIQNKFRYIDNPSFEMYLRLEIQDQYVRMACTNEDEVWGLIIKSKAMSASFRSIYQLMWSLATPITSDIVESWGENEYLVEERRRK